MLEAVIFDVDGTLLDSNDLHAKSWHDAFRAFGHDVALADVRRQIGKGGDQLMPVFLSKDALHAQGEAIEKRCGEFFKRDYLSKVVAFHGVRPLMERITADGKTLALASSADADELTCYKKIAGIEDLIPAETSSDDADKSKPHPDIFEAALQRLRLKSPRSAIVVGDTPYDAQAAMRAGIVSIGVTCGGWSSGELRRAGCAAVYANPADLLQHYESWRRFCD